MKLRALFFNKTLLRKDIFRFAPLWAIYFIGGTLVMLTALANTEGAQTAYQLSSTMGPFAVINMIYAVLAAQMLFGDLYKSRLCNALHALPMRRETWFCTHVIAGVAYSVVPHLIAAIFLMPMLGQFSWVALTWVAVMLMEYLFFFGLAVFCVFCTGNRFAQVAVYAIVNFLSLIVYWFVSVIYQPQLYGVQISEDIFALTCPVLKMAGNTQLLEFEWVLEMNSLGILKSEGGWVYMGPGEGWGYLGICAGIGVALLAAALVLYRRRSLECAGEFVAFARLKPVLAVVFALCCGGVVAAFGQSTGLADSYLLFLIVGLVVGWFGGQMLLQRTVRVFKGKTFAHLAILGLALALTVGLTAWDPVGITRYVPKAENVRMVEVTQGSLDSYNGPDIKTENAEEIIEVIQLHKKILKERNQYSGRWRTISIRYTLESGRQVTREYQVYMESKSWIKIQNLYSKPRVLLGDTDWVSWYNSVKQVYFNGYEVEQYVSKYNALNGNADIPLSSHTVETELLMAIFEDGCAGNLENARFVDKGSGFYVDIERTLANGNRVFSAYYILPRAQDCWKWLNKYEEILKVYGDVKFT